MLECHYEKEPLDLRLLLLRLWKQGWIILLATVTGTLVFGGGYYLKNVALPPAQYAAMSLYEIEYRLDPVADSTADRGYTYINGETWNRWMTTKEFLDLLYDNLKGTGEAQIDRETMKSYLSAELLTDLRMPDTIVTTPDPGLSLRLAAAVEQSMVDFAAAQNGIEEICVVDPAVETTSVNSARPLNACILSAVLTCFLTIAVLLLKELGQDGLWLPAELTKRYGLKAMGTEESRFLAENVKYLLGDLRSIGVLPVGDADSAEAVRVLREAASRQVTEKVQDSADVQWLALPDIMQHPEACERIRTLDGLVLAVKAGPRVGKRLEAVMELLDTQDCHISAALLWKADEKLIGRYYYGHSRTGV